MAPIAIQLVSELASTGQEHIIGKTAPSVAVNGVSDNLRKLDASQLVFFPNAAPKAVPQPNSPEVMAQNV